MVLFSEIDSMKIFFITKDFIIKKDKPIGYLLIQNGEKKYKIKKRRQSGGYYKIYGKHQRGGFLNRCNFACAGRDTVNTAMNQLNTSVVKLIQQTSNQVDQIAQGRIQQILNRRGK